jgi:hypothetical protein
MTTKTSKLIVIRSKDQAAENSEHHPLEVCPTCGQWLAPAVEPHLLPSAACADEHEKDLS